MAIQMAILKCPIRTMRRMTSLPVNGDGGRVGAWRHIQCGLGKRGRGVLEMEVEFNTHDCGDCGFLEVYNHISTYH